MTICRLPDAFAENPLALTEAEIRQAEESEDHYSASSCTQNLHPGFFFDGPGNNMLARSYATRF